MVASVRLESIAESELDNFLDTIRPPYAAERSLADHISYVEAEQFVRRQFEDSLPLGFRTLGHHFLRIVDTVTAVHVGIVWLRLEKRPTRRTSTTLQCHRSIDAKATRVPHSTSSPRVHTPKDVTSSR